MTSMNKFKERIAQSNDYEAVMDIDRDVYSGGDISEIIVTFCTIHQVISYNQNGLK